MDIPNSGAIFTLGKSYLAENNQSYFYIRNDPIKGLIAGPHQSAVICESGRLFVWGDNSHGQLGIGNQPNHNNNDNDKNNKTSYGDIITKPTCVKSLKTLGLKIVGIAFGIDWSIILAHSNEIFFSGRNIFPSGCNVSHNFTTTIVADEQCEIIRKPFRIDELDNCLTKNEDAEYYTTALAGNEHFVLMTSLGRLIAWGSNQNYQLGLSNDDTVSKPHEIKLDAPVQQFVCGPQSTLVLTTSGKFYLTGVLNEFVFTQFTELQQNLAPTEQIIFMHISKTNEIYIVTNSGSIYRSIESLRTKTLIFQRFYDYDSEENGPIWKLLKGFSFYTVLTKANKFYTTFSESGHHLKTFREISKFKNLRLLDTAVGNQHILVHGIPRSSTISATVGSVTEPHRYASRTFVMPSNFTNGSEDRIGSRGRSVTKASNKDRETGETEETKLSDINSNIMVNDVASKITSKLERESTTIKANGDAIEGIAGKSLVDKISAQTVEFLHQQEKQQDIEGNENGETKDNRDDESNHNIAATAVVVRNESNSPTDSEKTTTSLKLSSPAELSNKSPAIDKHLRPHTPYPESSTTASTPTTIKKTTPLRNYSYEAAMDHDHIEMTSPELVDSLEDIPEVEREDGLAKNSLPTMPFEEDEHLAVEINTTTDPLDSTIIVNEIRFINNGVDVTDNIKSESFDTEETESTVDSSEEHIADDYVHNAIGRKVSSGKTQGMESDVSKTIQKETGKTEQQGEYFVQSQVKNDRESTSEVKNESRTAFISHSLTGQVDDGLSTQSKNIHNAASENKTNLHTKSNNIGDEIMKAKDDISSEAEKSSGKVNKTARKSTAATTVIYDSMETGIKEGLSTKTKQKKESVLEGGMRKEIDFVPSAEIPTDTLTQKIENAAKKVNNGASEVRDSIEMATKHAVSGARDSAETVRENAKQVANDTKNTVDSIGSGARKVATEAKNAVGNVFIKMSDGTKDAVDTVAAKIAHEVQGAKENIATIFHGKNVKPSSPEDGRVSLTSEAGSKEDGPKTNTTIGEDDERTTASVNSTQNSTGNPFESPNPYDNEFDDVVERGKKALRDEINNMQQQGTQVTQQITQEAGNGKGKVRQFFCDIGGISCRNEKSVAVADEPPRYSVADKYPTQRTHDEEQNNTSKVCSIL
ncbi:X-linked retinitis pigmentosa GTPase regulator [Eurosta solidaginis]|uniref:X-linked retinitis pigmentosa GTPase regulator n=1 Tax=Eurosta solidaginis TaxID=178769 RepID=UPI0035307CFC